MTARASTDGSVALESIDPDRIGPQGRVAQFVVQCTLSHTGYDDPIVYPDEPGQSHLHTFFGNAMVDSNPDYERVAGAQTSCEQRQDTASYWAPALLDADGRVIEPAGITAYYRPGFGVDPATVEPYPAGHDARRRRSHVDRAPTDRSHLVVLWLQRRPRRRTGALPADRIVAAAHQLPRLLGRRACRAGSGSR